MSSLRHFLTQWAALGCAAALGLSCEKTKQEAAPAPTTSGPSARPALSLRCTPPGSTNGLTIGVAGSDPMGPDRRTSDAVSDAEAEAEAEAEEGPVDVPFSPELGRGAVTPFGFAVGALSSAAGGGAGSGSSGVRGQRALLALLGREGAGRLIEIGEASEPPRVVSDGERLIVASLQAGASGRTLRIGTIARALDKPELSWVGETELPSDPSSVASIEVGSKGVFVVWDERGGDAGKSAIWGRSLSLSDAAEKSDPVRLSPEGLDAVSPRLGRRRRGGYWLAYLSEQAGAAPPPPVVASADASQANGSGANDVSADDEPPATGERFRRQTLMLASLNERGELDGPSQKLGDSADHALLFDLEVLPDDRALLAVRQESTLPGSDAGSVQLYLVTQGRTSKTARVEVDDRSPGAPILLADAEAGGAAAALLSVPGRDGRTLLSPIQVDQASGVGGLVAGPLEPRLGYGEPLAVSRGKLSIATPRGGAIDLGVVACELAAGG